MKGLLPVFQSSQEYNACNHTEEMYLPAIREICARHSVPYGNLTKFDEGHAIVFAVGNELVIKLRPPPWSEQTTLEIAILNYIRGRLPTPTPEVVHEGTLDDWVYFVMTHPSGLRLSKVFPTLAEEEQVKLYAHMGDTIRELHSLPEIHEALPVPQWAEFVHRRRAVCQDRQANGGVNESLVEQIPSFLESYLPDPDASPNSSILHTELMRDEWYVRQENGSWTLSGIFDFGDVLIGDPRADCFWREFDRSLLKSYFSGYGYSGGCVSETLACTMLAFIMIHRYATLSWLFKPHPALLEKAVSLEAIALAVFPIRDN